ncbi:MAG: hypothetical protein EA402_06595 [Planctomycetota bacterium]|nr:MAG: hypothetical protein EA402_06595 [Planctomycetota bacterium]
MVTYIIVAVLGISALGTLVLAIFMLMDAQGAENKDDFASRVTKAVDSTANANGLWTRRLRIRAIIFLVLLLLCALGAVWVMQNFHGSTWNW